MKTFLFAALRFLSIALIAVAAGCSHSNIRTGHSTLSSLPPEIAAEFAYMRTEDFEATEKLREETASYTAREVKLKPAGAGTNDKRRIVIEFYSVKKAAGKTPVVMVLPMSGGGYGIERHFAAYFANRGYASVIVHRDVIPKELQFIENLDPMIQRTVLDHRRVIDWLETRAEVDATKVGIFGISMGGIKGAMLAPLEGRIRAAIIGLAGGDLPYILAYSKEPGVTRHREKFLAERGLTVEQGEAALRKIIKRDPLVYAPYIDPKRVLLVLARYDNVVPIVKGLELKERMSNPETIMLPSGHYTAAFSIPYIKSEAFDFLEKRFAEDAALASTPTRELTRSTARRRQLSR